MKKSGTTQLFGRHTCDLGEQIKEASSEDLRYVFDSILNDETCTTALKALADRHPVYFAWVLPVPEDKTRFPKNPDGLEWKAVLTFPQQWGELGVQFYKVIGTWLETNQIKTPKQVLCQVGWKR